VGKKGGHDNFVTMYERGLVSLDLEVAELASLETVLDKLDIVSRQFGTSF
jgi:hypothetical protein